MKIKLLIFSTLFSSIAVMGQQMIPLFEIFTSSTCGPCNAGNTNFKNVVAGKPVNDYVAVKYQQNFPGTGDPYATSETVGRLNYYAINSIPRMEINGGWNQNASSFTNALYNSARAATPLYDLNGTYYVNPTTKLVTVSINYKNLTSITSPPKLYVAIIENTTTQNKKTNGETIFENVVKKMLPSQGGSTLSANGNWQNKVFTFQFNGNYRLPANGQSANMINNAIEHSVEQFTDLRVVAWVQGTDAAKTVYQAVNLVANASTGIEDSNVPVIASDVNVYPNPMSIGGIAEFYLNKPTDVTITLVNSLGQVIKTDDLKTLDIGNHKYEIDVNALSNGLYFVNIKFGETIITKKISVLK